MTNQRGEGNDSEQGAKGPEEGALDQGQGIRAKEPGPRDQRKRQGTRAKEPGPSGQGPLEVEVEELSHEDWRARGSA